MTLRDFDIVVLDDYIVGVNSGTNIIDEFYSNNDVKKKRYMDCIVTSIFILNEDKLVVNIDVPKGELDFSDADLAEGNIVEIEEV